MRFTTRMTVLFGAVLAVFLVSTLPVTAALLRGVVGTPGRTTADWDKVSALWTRLDAPTKQKTQDLMDAVAEWKAGAAVPSLEGDARYLRFQTAFLMFSTGQAIVLLVLVILGLGVLMAPVRKMTRVVERLKAGETEVRLDGRGGAEWAGLAREFNTMLDRNQTLSRLQGWQEIAAFLSHQIKNPLTSMAFAEENVRALAPSLSEAATDNLDVIRDQRKRIDNLVRRLRDLTSFDQMSRSEVGFVAWMEGWIGTHRREGERWEGHFEDCGTVSLVALLWEQALDNLLANSREAASGVPLIRIQARSQGRLVVLEWSDGNRISEDFPVHLIGTPRYTTKTEGSGLGVFFVRRIAELHGGTLELGRTATGGLSFTVTLEGGTHGPDSHR